MSRIGAIGERSHRTSLRTRGGAALALLATALACLPAAADTPAPPPEAVRLDVLPGAGPLPADVAAAVGGALAAKGPNYEPRTRHRRADGAPRYTNRLILEDSPYLQQHAHNPVNWFAWGSDAFDKARREGKPVFLSIGYSTCHWCHVMERESFDDEAIATLLNEGFVAIKVDRELRPDIDTIYMTAVRLIVGHGGWPMSSFLTPDGEPFYGATYFPPQEFTALLQRVDQVWRSQRQALTDAAREIAHAVKSATAPPGRRGSSGDDVVAAAVDELLFRYAADVDRAPKFPHEPELLLLLETALRSGHAEALAVAERRLQAMAHGGVHDQVGGGFHRYATDSLWRVPHFEKMLYNQAQLTRAYLLAFELTRKPLYARVAQQTLEHVLRDMTAPEGVFYSATDADSSGREGAFFLWSEDEILAALGPDDGAFAAELFSVDVQGSFDGRNVLYLSRPLEAEAAARGVPVPDLRDRVDAVRERLRAARAEREHPLRDEKVLVAWNALMITALVEAYQSLGSPRYLEAATRAAEHLWRNTRTATGELRRLLLAGRSSVAAAQEDYAFLAEAMLALDDAEPGGPWLERARALVAAMLAHFWDDTSGGFFLNAAVADSNLFVRPKSPTDGAVPSGNAVAVRVLARLAARTGESAQRGTGAFGYMLLGAEELAHGRAGLRQHAAAGAVAVSAAATPWRDDSARVEVRLRIREGWHVTAHGLRQPNLTAMQLTIADPAWRLRSVAYPAPQNVDVSFQEQPLAGYRGDLSLRAELTRDGTATPPTPIVTASLRIQACSDRLCLPPEQLELKLPAAALAPAPP